MTEAVCKAVWPLALQAAFTATPEAFGKQLYFCRGDKVKRNAILYACGGLVPFALAENDDESVKWMFEVTDLLRLQQLLATSSCAHVMLELPAH